MAKTPVFSSVRVCERKGNTRCGIYRTALRTYTSEVKTLIDIDEVALQAAQAALGTTSKKETVNKSLAQAAALAARRRDLERLTLGLLPDLEDDSIMASAWQR